MASEHRYNWDGLIALGAGIIGTLILAAIVVFGIGWMDTSRSHDTVSVDQAIFKSCERLSGDQAVSCLLSLNVAELDQQVVQVCQTWEALDHDPTACLRTVRQTVADLAQSKR